MELLVDAVIDYALYLLNPKGEIVSWNPGARRLKGYEAEEVIGRKFHTFSRPMIRIAVFPITHWKWLRKADASKAKADGFAKMDRDFGHSP